MANPRKRVPRNVPGDFFVDSTCIDCETCRQMAPQVFGEALGTSFVKAQPVADGYRWLAGIREDPKDISFRDGGPKAWFVVARKS